MLLLRSTRFSRRAATRRMRLGGLAWLGAAVAFTIQLVAPAAVGAQVASPGGLDAAFGGDGIVTTEVSPFYDNAEALVVQPDGKLVVAGSADAVDPAVEYDWDFALVRYNPDGSLDTTFGGDGIVTTDFFGGGDRVKGLVLQPDGKLVAAGEASQPSTPETGAPADFALARYNPDGTLDTTFGTGGRVTTDLGNFDRISALTRQPDGKLVAVGGSAGFALARYNPDGTLDTTFGTGGRVTDTDGLSDANAVAVQPDGKVVVAASAGGGAGMGVARFNANGTLDSGFGTGGVVVSSYSWGPAEADALLVRPDGRILVGGSAAVSIPAWRMTLPDDFALVQYLPNGSVDWSFGWFGWVVTDFNGQDDQVNALVEQPDGKIVAAGGSGPVGDFRMARYSSSGALDYGFGNSGRVTASSGSAEAVVRQPDGKLVTAGEVNHSTSTGAVGYNDFAVLRFHA